MKAMGKGTYLFMCFMIVKCGSRGGGGSGGPDPPGKSQVIWVSIGNKQLEKVGPPPPPPPENVGPPWKMLDPL